MNLFGAMQKMLDFACNNPPSRFSGDGTNPPPGRTTATFAVWQSNGLALQATFSPEDQGPIRLSAVSLYEYPIGSK